MAVENIVKHAFARGKQLIKKFLGLLAFVVLGACASTPVPEFISKTEINDLTQEIIALGQGVDPAEAARAAKIALEYPLVLAAQYGITDAPLIHNTKVNAGRRPRGLCYHWADDMQARLKQEDFQTLQLHRAIANATNVLIEHSTVIVSQRGDTMFEGVILDPWRFGGTLYWGPTLKDERYKWVDRQEVFEYKAKRDKRRQG